MMQLMYFPQRREYAFITDASTLKPVPIGSDREEWFVCKEDARDAARENGFFMDGDVARMH